MSSEFPEGWSRQKLGDSLIPRAKSKLPSGESNPLGYYDFYVCSHKVLKSFHNEYSSPSILFSTGGEASVHLATERYAFSTDVWATEFEGDICNEYVFRLLEENIRTINYSGFQGSGIKHLDKSFIEKLEFSIPPLPEQKKIASILTSVDEVIENTQKQIDKLQDLKKATMNELLTKGIGHTEFKDSELGRIPKSWKEVSLGKLIDKLIDFRGRTPKKLGLDWGGGKIKALSANNVKMGRVDFEKECYLASNELYEKWMTKGDSRKDDVLFTMEAPLGNVCLVPDNNRYILSQRVILFRVNKLILPSYIHHTLASQYFQNTLVKHSTGTTATGIQQKNLVKLKLLVPSSIEEQQKIASIITSVDKKIEYIQKKLSQTQSLKKSLMQELLTGKVRVTVN